MEIVRETTNTSYIFTEQPARRPGKVTPTATDADLQQAFKDLMAALPKATQAQVVAEIGRASRRAQLVKLMDTPELRRKAIQAFGFSNLFDE